MAAPSPALSPLREPPDSLSGLGDDVDVPPEELGAELVGLKTTSEDDTCIVDDDVCVEEGDPVFADEGEGEDGGNGEDDEEDDGGVIELVPSSVMNTMRSTVRDPSAQARTKLNRDTRTTHFSVGPRPRVIEAVYLNDMDDVASWWRRLEPHRRVP
jgi:hypothetical protein